MRWAARAATSPSKARRTSTTCTTESSDCSTEGSKASARAWPRGATNTPAPWRETSRPMDLRRLTASRTTLRETPKRSDNCCSVGRRCSGPSSPLSMRRASWSATRSDKRSGVARGSMGVRRADNMAKEVVRSSYKLRRRLPLRGFPDSVLRRWQFDGDSVHVLGQGDLAAQTAARLARRGGEIKHADFIGRGRGQASDPRFLHDDMAGGAGEHASAVGGDAPDAGVDRGLHQRPAGAAGDRLGGVFAAVCF